MVIVLIQSFYKSCIDILLEVPTLGNFPIYASRSLAFMLQILRLLTSMYLFLQIVNFLFYIIKKDKLQFYNANS